MLLKKNLIYSGTEFLIVAVCQFAILKLIAQNLSVADIGVWSILVASIQMSKILDPGAVSGSLKYISLASQLGDKRTIEQYVAISLLIVFVTYVPLLFLMNIFLGDFILTVSNAERLEQSLYLIPYICFSFFVQIISLCLVGCINSMGYGYFKSLANVTGMLIQLIMSVILIEQYGLLGLTVSQLINYSIVILIALAIIVFRFKLNILNFFVFKPFLIKKVIKVGFFVQGTSICWTLFEFSLRMLMARFGGLEMSGFYEVAYRFSAQLRILASYLIAPITPTFIQKYNQNPTGFGNYYSQIFSNSIGFGLVGVTCIILSSPILSLFMFSEVKIEFIYFVLLCSLGAFMHVTAMVSEQCAVSIGLPKYNLLGSIFILLFTYVFCFPLGIAFDGQGVSLGVFIAIFIGALITVFLNSKWLLKVDFLPNFSFFYKSLVKIYNGVKK